MGIVEIRPRSGVYDYASKYTKGLTEYIAPATVDAATAAAVREAIAAIVSGRGKMLNPATNSGGMLTGCLRVTVGTPEENIAFLKALETVV